MPSTSEAVILQFCGQKTSTPPVRLFQRLPATDIYLNFRNITFASAQHDCVVELGVNRFGAA